MELEQHDLRPIDRSAHELLIVDDDPVSRYATARLLRSAGFRTREAGTGVDGLHSAANGGLSAMVVDVHLPDIDGFELCRILREHEQTRRLPVLHLSAAYVTDEDKVRGLDSGADAYLTHPVEPAVLVATVQALVRTHVAEDAMRRSEARFRAIYELAPNGIALLDAAGCIIDANPAMRRLLGREVESLRGRLLADFAQPEHKQAAHLFSTQTARQGALAPYDDVATEIPMVSCDGDVVQVEWRISPGIEPGTHMVVATDVTPRRLLEQQRQQLLDRERMARGEAERINRMKDTFIAVLSHELRAPLNAIMGWTHVLLKRGGPDETVRGLTAIERNGNIQARMISDLLDMSRLNMGKLPLAIETVDPVDAVHAALSAMAPSIAEKNIDVQLELHSSNRPIQADGSRLQQVIWNLLSNAIKFSAPGGRVTVGVRDEGDEAVLSVRDEGQGIAPDFLPFVFDRFSQSDAGSNRHRGGLGLGLSIVKQLTEAHGGTVSVASAGLGHGATFEVRLPSEAAVTVAGRLDDESAAGEHADSGPGPLDDASADSIAKARLLVVEDDPDASAMLQLILGDRGATVEVAKDYDTALALLNGGKVDLLVSDIGMPGKDGYDLIREIRRRELVTRRHLPAVALTSFARPQDIEQALAAGFDAHCAKPLRPHKLMNVLSGLLLARRPPGDGR
jgi:PAS domain S-box-containing protein